MTEIINKQREIRQLNVESIETRATEDGEMEKWKDVRILDKNIDINKYVGYYKVSSLGRFYSVRSKKIMKISLSKEGYYVIGFNVNGEKKQYKAHRVIMMSFDRDNYFDGAEIDHIDTDRTNNHINNLRWVTCEENINNPLTKKKMRISQTGSGNNFSKSVQVFNSDNVIIREFDCATDCAKWLMTTYDIKLNTARTTISLYKNKNNLYKKSFYFITELNKVA